MVNPQERSGVNLTSFTLSDNLKSIKRASLLLMDTRASQACIAESLKCREKITAIRNSHMARNVSPIYSVVFCRTTANSLLLIGSLFTAGVSNNATEDKSINFPQCHTDQTEYLLKSIVSLNSTIKNTIKSTTVLPIFKCTIFFL